MGGGHIIIKELRSVPKVILFLVVGGFIQSTGHSLMWPLNSLFMHNQLGRSLTEAGLIIALQSGASLVGQFFSGILADRFGARRLMLIGLICSFLSIGLIGLFPIWEIYAPCLILFGFAVSFVFVPLNTLIHLYWPEGGRRGYNLLYVFNNAGVAVGTALGGLVAAYSFKLVFFTNSLTFLLFFLLVIWGIPRRQPEINQGTKPDSEQDFEIAKKKPAASNGFSILVLVSLGLLFIWSAYSQLTTILPVIMENEGYSMFHYSILWTLNGIFIVCLQPFTQWIIRKWSKSYYRQILSGALLFCLGFVILLINPPYVFFLLAILFITLGEMFILPVIPTIAAHLAPPNKQGTYQGIVGGASAGGRMLGPLLGGALYDHGGAINTWIFALLLMLLSLIAFSAYHSLSRSNLSE